MFSSLLRQRALLVVKQVTGNNGLEVYRLLVQQNEPASKNRSMSLLSVIMSWPAFNGKSSLMQQLLKLEHAYSEYERLGTKLNDDLKTAVLMRSITGQLKTWLQLQVNESTTYSKVREMVMMYDSQTTKWSEQMVLGVDAASSSVDGPIPMEVDRIQSKGKQKGKGKGKTNDRDGQKGKSKGKQKGKDAQKGKGKFQKGAKGSSDGSNGKGKGEPKKCYVCGKTGHFARDCWQSSQIRNVASDVAQGSTAQGSPGHPHHLGQHQTHHFRQHPKITQPSHFGRSLWATRISSLWATRKTSFLSSHYLTQPFKVCLGGEEGSFYLHHCLTQPFRVWLGGGGIILLTSLLDSAI